MDIIIIDGSRKASEFFTSLMFEMKVEEIKSDFEVN
jgi:hypothetical protein